MIYRRISPYVAAFILCLLISIGCGQDWLDGGYVGSYSWDAAQYFTDPIFNPNQRQIGEQIYYPYFGEEFFRDYAYPYQFRNGTYPGPYGVYPFYQTPYYSDFRLSSLAGMESAPLQKNWSETLNYAQTKSSFRVYPRSGSSDSAIQFPTATPTYTTTQPTATTTGNTPVTIVSQGMRGYQVFLDGNYIGTEGTGGDPLDGKFSFNVVGNQNHEVRVYDGQFNYPKTIFFEMGVQKIIYVEPGTAVYI